MTFLEKLRCLLTFGKGVALPLPDLSELDDPFSLFDTWFNDAKSAGILLPESMSISTVDSHGRPSSRMVLLKSFDEKGFVFYTNYNSKKSQDLNHNPHIAVLFHWGVLQRQIRIEGKVQKVTQQESEAYFHSRDRGSQIGAWASKQSAILEHDSALKERVAEYEQSFSGKQVPLPEFWGGWRVIPSQIEFWQGRASRLHDRLMFEITENSWRHKKLYP